MLAAPPLLGWQAVDTEEGRWPRARHDGVRALGEHGSAAKVLGLLPQGLVGWRVSLAGRRGP